MYDSLLYRKHSNIDGNSPAHCNFQTYVSVCGIGRRCKCSCLLPPRILSSSRGSCGSAVRPYGRNICRATGSCGSHLCTCRYIQEMIRSEYFVLYPIFTDSYPIVRCLGYRTGCLREWSCPLSTCPSSFTPTSCGVPATRTWRGSVQGEPRYL